MAGLQPPFALNELEVAPRLAEHEPAEGHVVGPIEAAQGRDEQGSGGHLSPDIPARTALDNTADRQVGVHFPHPDAVRHRRPDHRWRRVDLDGCQDHRCLPGLTDPDPGLARLQDGFCLLLQGSRQEGSRPEAGQGGHDQQDETGPSMIAPAGQENYGFRVATDAAGPWSRVHPGARDCQRHILRSFAGIEDRRCANLR